MYTLIELPYALNDLEPAISAKTLEYHYVKHLKGYVDNLNKLVPGTEFEGLPLEQVVLRSSGAIFNNAGQILNHNLYFTQFRSPETSGSGAPSGPLADAITAQWGSVEAFKAEFEAKGASLFGSGWVWLSAADDGTLQITQEAGASNPITRGLKPLLTFDVWEHAYYLDYQNRRADHLKVLWSIVDWKVVERRNTK